MKITEHYLEEQRKHDQSRFKLTKLFAIIIEMVQSPIPSRIDK